MKRNTHRIPHIIKPKQTFHQPSSFLFFDTETKDDKTSGNENTERHRLWFGCTWAFRYEGGRPTRSKQGSFNTPAEFWELVKERTDKKRPLYVMAHNLGFDLTAIDFWHTAEDFGYVPSYYVLESPPKMISGEFNGGRVIFLDTYNYWQSSVDAMGDSLGISKYDYPKGNPSKKVWTKYCLRDVEIIANQVMRLLDFLNNESHSSFGISAASLAMNVYKAHFMKHEIFVHDRNSVLKLERESYSGGLVHNFFIGEVKNQPIYYYDVNSLYPTMMRGMFPTKMVASGENPSLDFRVKWKGNHGFIAKVDLYSANDAYTKTVDHRMCQVTGKVTTTLAGEELTVAFAKQHVKKVHHYAVYELAPVMRDYVDYFWNLRCQYKKEGDRVNEQFVKLLMNSLYGKFGMKGHDWNDYTVDLLAEVYAHYGIAIPDEYLEPDYCPSISTITQSWYPEGLLRKINLRFVGGKLQMQIPTGEHSESFCAIASFVTSYARQRLRGLIKTAGIRQVYYCDTDSLFVTQLGHERLSKAGEIDPTSLGKLKLEGMETYALFNGPKDYVFGKKVKLKGISKRAELQEDGSYEQLQFEGIKGILKRGAEGYIDIKRIRKHLKRRYTKGTITSSGWTTPFTLSDW